MTNTAVLVEMIGYAAAAAVATTYSMKAMLPLRIAGIASNVLFILYGALSGTVPVLALHVFLLPLNVWRLYQLLTCAAVASGAPWQPPAGAFSRVRRLKRRPARQARLPHWHSTKRPPVARAAQPPRAGRALRPDTDGPRPGGAGSGWRLRRRVALRSPDGLPA